MMDRYEHIRDIGSGNFGVARLMRDMATRELVAIKYIERGEKIDQNVQREIINHRSLRHPNIVRFKEVCLTDTHLAIVMEYAAGGELFDRICKKGPFSEDEARFFFQQLISGVNYFHAMKICHRDLKLENTLLDGSSAPRLKICDFGYSKSSVLHSAPKSAVGTPAYIAPEVFSRPREAYDGKTADVWSCGVTLYVMLVGEYPFEDLDDPKNFRKTFARIMNVQYTIPSNVNISPECRHLLSRIFVADPTMRIQISEIMRHPWFLKNLPRELALGSDPSYDSDREDYPVQSIEEIMQIISEARTKLPDRPPTADIPLDDAALTGISNDQEKQDQQEVEGEGEAVGDRYSIPTMSDEEEEIEYFDIEESSELDETSDIESSKFSKDFKITKCFHYLIFIITWSGSGIRNYANFITSLW